MKRIIQKVNPVYIVIGTVLIYAIVLVFSDLQEAIQYIISFPIFLFIAMLCLAMGNYLIRFVKWHYFLGILQVKVPIRTSLGVFFAGFSMTITPMKSGELIKSYLLQSYGHPMSHTAPVILVERLTDLLGMIVLVILGAYTLGTGILPIFILLAVVSAFIVILQIEPLTRRIIDIIGNFPILNNNKEKLSSLYTSTLSLTRPKPLVIGLILSVISWFFECVCLFVAIGEIGFHTSLLNSVFIFAFSNIAGILAMLPGGLGATEGVMMLLLSAEGIPLGAANAATLLARFTTLWFAVLLGILSLLIMKRSISDLKSLNRDPI